jgi:hypothetical protein
MASGSSLKVYVRSHLCNDWFWDLQEYFSQVSFRRFSPRDRLSAKLGRKSLPLDFPLNDQQIIQLGVLRLPDPFEDAESPVRWILLHKLGKTWAESQPSWDHFSALVHWYAHNTVSPSARILADSIVADWIAECSGKLRSAYTRLREDPQKHALSIIAWRALEPYPNNREQWLEDEKWFSNQLIDLADRVQPGILPKSQRITLNARMRAHWNTRLSDASHYSKEKCARWLGKYSYTSMELNG